jgi:hypothetical protein
MALYSRFGKRANDALTPQRAASFLVITPPASLPALSTTPLTKHLLTSQAASLPRDALTPPSSASQGGCLCMDRPALATGCPNPLRGACSCSCSLAVGWPTAGPARRPRKLLCLSSKRREALQRRRQCPAVGGRRAGRNHLQVRGCTRTSDVQRP